MATTKKATAKKATTKKATTKKANPKKTAPATAKDDGPTIPELLAQLEKATNSGEKKALRRQLRALGHEGGLRKQK